MLDIGLAGGAKTKLFARLRDWNTASNRRQLRLFTVLLFSVQLLLHLFFIVPSTASGRLDAHLVQKSGRALARAWLHLPAASGEKLEADDDPGAAYVMAGQILLTQSKAEIARGAEADVPLLYLLFFDFLYLIILLSLQFTLEKMVGTWLALAAVVLLLASSQVNAIAFMGDIYLFPLFSVAALLGWIQILSQNPRRGLFTSPLLALLLFLSDLFRNSSILVGLALLLVIIAPSRLNLPRRARAASLSVCLIFFGLKIFCAPKAAHPLWQSIHAGFFEFGGWIDGEKAYPAFVTPRAVPANAAFRPEWADSIQETLLRKSDPSFHLYGDYQESYHRFFKGEVLRLIRENKRGVATLLAKRIWRISVANPWQATISPNSPAIKFQEPRDTLLRLLVWLPIFFALYRGLLREPFALLLLSLLTQAIPLLLVYSGYITYSMPFYVIVWLLWLISLRFLLVPRLAPPEKALNA